MDKRPISTIRSALELSFPSYDGVHETEEISACIIVDVVDTLEMIANTLQSTDPGLFNDEMERLVRRSADRLRLALRVDDEVEPADERATLVTTPEGYIIPESSQFWLVPINEDGEPDFDDAQRATSKDMLDRGWVWRAAACDAIKTMLEPPNQAAKAEDADPESSVRRAAS